MQAAAGGGVRASSGGGGLQPVWLGARAAIGAPTPAARPAAPLAPCRSILPQLADLASRTGRAVSVHLSLLLAALEAAGLLPSESAAQEELELEHETAEDSDVGDLGFGDVGIAPLPDEEVRAGLRRWARAPARLGSST